MSPGMDARVGWDCWIRGAAAGAGKRVCERASVGAPARNDAVAAVGGQLPLKTQKWENGHHALALLRSCAHSSRNIAAGTPT